MQAPHTPDLWLKIQLKGRQKKEQAVNRASPDVQDQAHLMDTRCGAIRQRGGGESAILLVLRCQNPAAEIGILVSEKKMSKRLCTAVKMAP